MDTYNCPEIQEVPLQSSFFRSRVERFLAENGLRPEALDTYYSINGPDGEILAGAGIKGDVIKCVAVADGCRSAGYTVPLLSRLVSDASSRGLTGLKVFTKPEYETVFASLGFHTLAKAPKAVLMENGRGLQDYCTQLAGLRRQGSAGVVIMNANPFTLGHEYLLKEAAARVDTLFVIPVKEDVSRFPYAERMEMIRACAETPGQTGDDVMPGSDRASAIVVVDGSDYQISATTFPTYFLKDLSDASETQMRLDIDLFCRHIAPALGAGVRFVGSEPSDPLTARYNALMQELLPAADLMVVEIPRLQDAVGPVSASRVRASLDAGSLSEASALTPPSSHPYLLADLADRALRLELETPLKPGLVSPDSCGAHKDMDYALMLRGIEALRPFWSRMAVAGDASELQRLGVEAERAMLAATGGVNTHRGAIFCLGLAVAAAPAVSSAVSPASARETQPSDIEQLMQNRLGRIAQSVLSNKLKDSELQNTHGRQAVAKYHVAGAMELAIEGYKALSADWLPYYRSVKGETCGMQKTLLRIMSTLDDTCVIHRVGPERAIEVKREAAALLAGIPGQARNDDSVMAGWTGHLREMCSRYASEGISPGGAADMLALTILTDMLLR